MRQKVIEISDEFGDEFKGKYVFREITWAKRNRIVIKHTRYHPMTGKVINADYVAIQAETIWASLKEQPKSKPITLERLLDEENGIPIELGNFLSEAANEVCGLTPQERKNSSGR